MMRRQITFKGELAERIQKLADDSERGFGDMARLLVEEAVTDWEAKVEPIVDDYRGRPGMCSNQARA